MICREAKRLHVSDDLFLLDTKEDLEILRPHAEGKEDTTEHDSLPRPLLEGEEERTEYLRETRPLAERDEDIKRIETSYEAVDKGKSTNEKENRTYKFFGGEVAQKAHA